MNEVEREGHRIGCDYLHFIDFLLPALHFAHDRAALAVLDPPMDARV